MSGSSEAKSDEDDVGESSGLGGWTIIKKKQLLVRFTQLYEPNSEESKRIFEGLEREIEYLEGELSQIKVFGKTYPLPRKQALYGNPGIVYSYSNIRIPTQPWTPLLKKLRDQVAAASECEFNFVLINRYKDGKDHAGEHKDDEKELDPSAPIASLTFGAERDFYFKHQNHRRGDKSEPVVSVKLTDGMLLLMENPTNKFWYHALPVRKRCSDVRINLTFRKIMLEKMKPLKK